MQPMQPSENEAASGQAEHPAPLGTERKEARNRALKGSGLCALGLAITAADSFGATEAVWMIAAGAVVWGAMQAIRGITAYSKLQYSAGDYTGMWQTTGLAIGAAAILLGTILIVAAREEQAEGGLSLPGIVKAFYLPSPYDAGQTPESFDGRPLLDQPQVYRCDSLGIRFRLPAGFAAYETDAVAESEANYGICRMSSDDGYTEVTVECVPGYFAGEEIRTVAEAMDHIRQCNPAYFDAGLLYPPKSVKIGGTELLKSAGRRTEFPDYIFTRYDGVNRGAWITVYFNYPGEEPDREEDNYIRRLIRGLEVE